MRARISRRCAPTHHTPYNGIQAVAPLVEESTRVNLLSGEPVSSLGVASAPAVTARLQQCHAAVEAIVEKAIQARDMAEQERDTANQQRVNAIRARDKSNEARDKAIQERHKANQERDKAINQLDQRVKELEGLVAKREVRQTVSISVKTPVAAG